MVTEPSMNLYEKIAGWCMVRSFKKHDRAARKGSMNDAHERRPIVAGLHAGDTGPCDETCPLWLLGPMTAEEVYEPHSS